MAQVLTMGMFFGSGPTASPTAIPLGLPSLEAEKGDYLIFTTHKFDQIWI